MPKAIALVIALAIGSVPLPAATSAGETRPTDRDYDALAHGVKAYALYDQGEYADFMDVSGDVLEKYVDERSRLIDEVKIWMHSLRITSLKNHREYAAIPGEYDHLIEVKPDLDNPVYLRTITAALIDRAMAYSMLHRTKDEIDSYHEAFDLYKRLPETSTERYVVEAMYDLILLHLDNDRPESSTRVLREVLGAFEKSTVPTNIRFMGSAAMQTLSEATAAGAIPRDGGTADSQAISKSLDAIIDNNSGVDHPITREGIEYMIRARSMLAREADQEITP
ncbi:MAG: hypothetical protein LBJ46_10870 [Planctomycetota bacterium]|jgi:hypothetical protein|nr:hypothetical protein [Planctomycetota bacterium]